MPIKLSENQILLEGPRKSDEWSGPWGCQRSLKTDPLSLTEN